MSILAENHESCNTFSSCPTNGSIHSYNLHLTTDGTLKNATGYHRNNLIQKELNKIIKEKNYKGAPERVLKQIGYRLELDLTSRASQKKLAKESRCSDRQVRRCYKIFSTDGILTYERGSESWQDRETNITTMLCLQHLLPSVADKMSYDINTLTNLQDLNNTYIEYECVIANSKEKKSPYKPKSIPPDKHIDNQKLKTEPEHEIKRACIAYGVPENQITYVGEVLKKKSNLSNPGAFLANMLQMMKDGTWKITSKNDSPKSIPDHELKEMDRMAEQDAITFIRSKGYTENHPEWLSALGSFKHRIYKDRLIKRKGKLGILTN